MLKDILQEHIKPQAFSCAVQKWIDTQEGSVQEDFKTLKTMITENSRAVNTAKLLSNIEAQTTVPFKLTAFRSHMRGYCTCQ
jgi:hypothetical protein